MLINQYKDSIARKKIVLESLTVLKFGFNPKKKAPEVSSRLLNVISWIH